MIPTQANIVLVDTNIVSYLFKKDTRAHLYAPLLEGNRLAVSFATVAELFEWAYVRKWGQRRRQKLTEKLATYLVIPVNVELCRNWGLLRAEQQSKGVQMNTHDAWIAATARLYSVPIVTHNPKHFLGIPGIEVRTMKKEN